jgi:hypothetical protein
VTYFADQLIAGKDPFEGLEHGQHLKNEKFLQRYFQNKPIGEAAK